jgi:sRNA-binding protein
MIILVILHWITFQKQSKEIKRLQLLIKLQGRLHNEHMKTAIQEAEEAQARFNIIQSANKSRKESLQKEIKEKLDGIK